MGETRSSPGQVAALGLREVCLVLQKIKVQFQEFQVFFVGDDFVDLYSFQGATFESS